MEPVNFKNHFLISMPSLENSIFSTSVIFLCDHHPEGAMGIMINKSLHINLSSILEHLNIEVTDPDFSDDTVYMGGPVSPESGFIIHTPYRQDEQNQDLVISASKDILTDIAEGKGPEHYLVSLGYASWNAGQLEAELMRNDWLVVPYDKNIIFQTTIDSRWKNAIESLGIHLDQLSFHTGHV